MCRFCELEIGQEVRCNGDNYFPCCFSSVDNTGELAKYIKYDGAFHYFRIYRSFRCPECGTRGSTITLPCMDYRDGVFLREKVRDVVYDT